MYFCFNGFIYKQYSRSTLFYHPIESYKRFIRVSRGSPRATEKCSRAKKRRGAVERNGGALQFDLYDCPSVNFIPAQTVFSWVYSNTTPILNLFSSMRFEPIFGTSKCNLYPCENDWTTQINASVEFQELRLNGFY